MSKTLSELSFGMEGHVTPHFQQLSVPLDHDKQKEPMQSWQRATSFWTIWPLTQTQQYDIIPAT